MDRHVLCCTLDKNKQICYYAFNVLSYLYNIFPFMILELLIVKITINYIWEKKTGHFSSLFMWKKKKHLAISKTCNARIMSLINDETFPMLDIKLHWQGLILTYSVWFSLIWLYYVHEDSGRQNENNPRPCETKAEVTKTSGFSLFGERMSSGLLSNGVVVGSPPRIGSHVCKFESFAFVFLLFN